MPQQSQPNRSNQPDVRMRGFSHRTSVTAAWEWIDRLARPLRSERLPLPRSARRALAETIVSTVDAPSFDRAMMDGYALQAASVQGASPYNRLPLVVVGESLPGRPFGGTVGRGEAARITTGAPLPRGADAVLPAELTEPIERDSDVADSHSPRDSDDRPLAHREAICAIGDVAAGKHLGLVGEDLRRGDELFAAGRILRPQDLGLMSSVGVREVAVVRRPRVQLVVTGSELLPWGATPVECKIADANGPMLQALVERDGGEVLPWRLVPDERDAIRDAIHAPADVIVVSGGSSVGLEDHAPRVLAECGELSIHGVAMRPSSPTGMGRLGERLVFLLPGNPVSCLCAYDFFAGRAIRALGGRAAAWPYRAQSRPLARKLVSAIGRVDYARVRLMNNEVEPLAIGGASVLSSTTRADGFVVVPESSEGYPAGASVEVFLYDG